MPRYIDADFLKRKVNIRSSHWLNEWDTLGVLSVIDETPTADVEEVRHGRFVGEIIKTENWKGQKTSYYQPHSCSLCHTALAGTENYCPNCGAKMDLEEEAQ